MGPFSKAPRPASRETYLAGSALSASRAGVPVWLKVAYGGFVVALVPVYWHHYGPQNFLWLSDLALFATTASLITGARWPAGMAAVGVLPLELAWSIDFVAGGRILDLAGYMFDPAKPLYLRGLSLFHLALPPTLIWLLYRFGYDRRSLLRQTALTTVLLPATWLITAPEENINWVYGPGAEPQAAIPPLLYLALQMAVLPLLAYLPTHFVLKRMFRPAR